MRAEKRPHEWLGGFLVALGLVPSTRTSNWANCRAEFKINGKVRYFLSDEVKLDDQSGADWETIVDYGCHEHSEYCKNQGPKGDLPKLDDFVRDQITGPEMKEHN